jgi:DNA-binding CsgD family transcriptional regulator
MEKKGFLMNAIHRFGAMSITQVLLLCFVFSIYSCKDESASFLTNQQDLQQLISKHPKLDSANAQLRRGEYDMAKGNLTLVLGDDSASDSLIKYFVLDQLGIINYQTNQVDSAIFYWKEIDENYTHLIGLEQRSSMFSNLGSAYMYKGYYQMAISYFLEAKRGFDRLNVKTENFWINHMNVGVAYMESQNFVLAEKYFKEIPLGLSNSLDALVHINLAKLFALQNQKKRFSGHIKLAEGYIQKTNFYKGVFLEVLFEFGLELDAKNELAEAYNNYQTEIGKHSVVLDFMLCKSAIALGKPSPLKEQEILALKSDIPGDDFIGWKGYYDLLGIYYHSKGQYHKAYKAIREAALNESSRDVQRNKADLLDFTLLAERKDIQRELEVQIKENEAKSNSVEAQFYFILALFLLIFLLIVSSAFLYYRTKQRGKHIQEDLKLKSLELKLAQQRQELLEQDLVFKSQKLSSVLATVSKIAILKKQIESFFKLLEEQDSTNQLDSSMIRQAKLDFTMFFNNYQDLAVMANLEGSDAQKVLELQESHPQLNENERRVMLLISQNYTSKEMSLLLSCTEKNIEYYRAQIRKKLEIPKEISINSYIKSIF